MPGSAKQYLVLIGVTAAIGTTLLMASCISQKTPPDPAELEQQIIEARAGELDLVRATIGDPQRATEFIELLNARDDLVDSYTRDVAQHRIAIARLNADYDAERNEFETLLADFNRNRTSVQGSLLDLLTKMKETTTDGEWRVISDFQSDNLDVRHLVYGRLKEGAAE
jgi:hypothetical protein